MLTNKTNNSAIAKSDLIRAVFSANQDNNSQASIRRIIDGLLNSILKSIQDGTKEIRLTGFGAFRIRYVDAKSGVNPKTGKPMSIKGYYQISFRPGRGTKAALAHAAEQRLNKTKR